MNDKEKTLENHILAESFNLDRLDIDKINAQEQELNDLRRKGKK